MGIDVRRALLHWVAYSAEARNPLRLPAFCFRRSSSQIANRIALTHSTPLPFPAQFACALFALDFAGDGAKAYLTGKSQAKVAAKKTRKKPEGPCFGREGAGRSCMDGASRGLAFGAGHLRKTRLRLIGPPLFPTSKRHVLMTGTMFPARNVPRARRL